MRRLRLTIEYDGSDFAGWQAQPGGARTVQATLHAALAALPGRHGPVHGAGRTDAGVHALAMVAHVDTDTGIAAGKLRLALNAHLPRDVAVLEVQEVAPTFEAQFDCRYRRYLFRIRRMRHDAHGLALLRLRVLPVFARLDVAAMREAAAATVGRRDFAAFATRETRTTERTVLLCEVRERDRELELHVAADGFLRTMVRTLVGSLLWVGTGHLSVARYLEVLASGDRARAGRNVRPHGLYFVEAGYEPWDPQRSEEAFRRVDPR